MTLRALSSFLLLVSACNAPSDKPETGSDPEIDLDADGFFAADDCDDERPDVFPGAVEACNTVDDDCNGVIDDAPDAPTWYGDADADGFGGLLTVVACDAPEGFVAEDGDCDDADGGVSPGAVEACNEADDNCDGQVDEGVAPMSWYGDADGDGFGGGITVEGCEAPAGFVADAGDCDDGDAAAYPGAAEACSDVVDYNCDGSVGYADADGDGTPACEDCDDADGTAFPGAVEACDGVDDDCDGAVDEDAPDAPTWYADVDADGFGDDASPTMSCDMPVGTAATGGDCDDSDAAWHPGATESCDVDLDYNCDGSTGGDDADGDGVRACEDCDDADGTAFPGALEACDGDDEDCDGEVDEAGAEGEATWYADADGDTYGDAASTLIACDAAVGFVANATDCDDTSASVSPGATEVCDDAARDEDCDGAADDADPSVSAASELTWYVDYDSDGYGSSTITVSACEAPARFVANADDCDDAHGDVNPAGSEVCDEDDLDEDCDGSAEDADFSVTGRTLRYFDGDGDGYGVSFSTLNACDFPSTYVENDDDCDDTDGAVSPGATEVCDAADRDEDCDGAADDADFGTSGEASFHYDGDGDSYGDPAISTSSCDGGAGWVADATDCDDDDRNDHPGAVESVGNEDDEDCDGLEICYTDGDDDGYRLTTTRPSLDADCADAGEAAAAAPATDCDDGSASVSPAGAESCNEVDDDCDGTVDEGVGGTYYADTDGDGYGDPAGAALACSLPTGYAANDDDCDDGEPLAAPNLSETCGDGIDNDCGDDPEECSFDGSYAASTYDFRMTGSASSDYMGKGVTLGDFDGDGTGDLSGGMYLYDSPASSTGAAVVWYGPLGTSGTPSATGATLLTGTASSAYVGYYLAAGDHDGDGADELIVGAYGVSSSAGAVYITYGGSRRSSGQIAAASGVAIITGGASSDYLGYNVAAGGDLDGDGTDEVLLGAYGQDGAASTAGAAYLLYGSSTRRSGTASATTADATIRGVASGDYLGWSSAFVPDMDGDGLDELLLGSQYATSTDYGQAYLFLGDTTHLSGTYSASTADVIYQGLATYDYAGTGIYGFEDVTGDGYGDAGVHGSGYDNGSATSAGALWVFGGGTSLSTTAVATLYGASSSDYHGEEAYSPGDMDGDGVNDLLVASYGQDTAASSAGAAYLWHGPVSGSMSASTADAIFYGATTGDGYFGRRVPDAPGDVTGDGFPDIVVGAYWDDSYAYDAGALYVWEGLGGE